MIAAKEDVEIYNRIVEAISQYGGAPTLAIGAIVSRTRHIKGFKELLEAIDFTCRWKIQYQGATYHPRGIRALLLHRFIDVSVNRVGWFPATFYRDQYGIPAARLRKAVQQGRLGSDTIGKTVLYPFAGVRALWAQDVTFAPEKSKREEA